MQFAKISRERLVKVERSQAISNSECRRIATRRSARQPMATSGRSAQVPEARQREIGELAEAVANEHFPKGRVDPVVLAGRKGITFSFNHYGASFDGLLEHRSGRFHIYCNLERCSGPTTPRARFTLGHELGHFFIDEHRNALAAGVAPHKSVCDYESTNPVEREADLFASHFLMPSLRFTQIGKTHDAGFAAILGLSEEFDSSVSSTANRYLDLELTPCTLIKWTSQGFRWKRFSSTTHASGLRKTIETIEQLPADSPTARALNGERPVGSRFFKAGTVTSSWFQGVVAGSMRDEVLVEEAFSLGQYGVLTLLYPESSR